MFFFVVISSSFETSHNACCRFSHIWNLFAVSFFFYFGSYFRYFVRICHQFFCVACFVARLTCFNIFGFILISCRRLVMMMLRHEKNKCFSFSQFNCYWKKLSSLVFGRKKNIFQQNIMTICFMFCLNTLLLINGELHVCLITKFILYFACLYINFEYFKVA